MRQEYAASPWKQSLCAAYIVRVLLVNAFGLFVSFQTSAAGGTNSVLIRAEGPYSPEAGVFVRVSPDALGKLQCTLAFVLQESGETTTMTNNLTLDVGRGDKFLGYWDSTKQTFWIITAKTLISTSKQGTTNYVTKYYRTASSELERTPKVFGTEAKRMFNLP